MDRDTVDAIFREFERIGLRMEDLPGLMMSADSGAELLQQLRRLPPGATWRDALPDLPAHWVRGQPDTWTVPYRPVGSYDYQELPTGPAVHVRWRAGGDRARMDAFAAAARAGGWPVYSAGPIDAINQGDETFHAFIILERGTPEDMLWEFTHWIDQQSEPELAAVPRTGSETYIP